MENGWIKYIPLQFSQLTLFKVLILHIQKLNNELLFQ